MGCNKSQHVNVIKGVCEKSIGHLADLGFVTPDLDNENEWLLTEKGRIEMGEFVAMIAAGKSLSQNDRFLYTATLPYWLSLARMKHPEFAKTKDEALKVIWEEIAEFRSATIWESDLRVIEEAHDVITVLCRFILGEHIPSSNVIE